MARFLLAAPAPMIWPQLWENRWMVGKTPFPYGKPLYEKSAHQKKGQSEHETKSSTGPTKSLAPSLSALNLKAVCRCEKFAGKRQGGMAKRRKGYKDRRGEPSEYTDTPCPDVATLYGGGMVAFQGYVRI